MVTKAFTKAEVKRLLKGYNGVCESCGCVKRGGVEPDATGYECKGCGENRVMGLEWALLVGVVEVTP